MRKIAILSLVLVAFLISCNPEKAPGNEPFCGDSVCQANERESGCKADCGGFESITKLQCTQANGHWNDCGSPCAGTGANICIEACSPQCECGGIAGFSCPSGYKCRLSGKIADEMGVCIKS